MSVYASQRKKSEMQFMATALKLQDEILGRWEHNFGIKFTKRVYDRATGEITTNRLEPYKPDSVTDRIGGAVAMNKKYIIEEETDGTV